MHPLAPKLGPNEAGKKLGKDARWDNFARKIQHHPALKAFLIAKQSGKCPICGRGVGMTDTAHHTSYLGRCLHEQQVDVIATSARRGQQTVKTPPCEGCPALARCASLLVLVHDRCHYQIHAAD